MLTLTPQSRAIAAFTLAVLLLFGHLNRAALAVVLVFGSSYPDGRGGLFLTSAMTVAIAAAVAWFAMNTVGVVGASTGWDSHLARAAVVVAVVGLVIAIMLGIGSVANNTGGFPGGYGVGLFF